MLGICYGLQFMVHTLGGKVRPAEKREYGHAEIDVVSASVLFRDGQEVGGVDVARRRSARIPPGFELMAKTHYAVAGIQNPRKSGMQCSFIRKSTTRRRAHRCWEFVFEIAARSRHGRRSDSSIRRSSR